MSNHFARWVPPLDLPHSYQWFIVLIEHYKPSQNHQSSIIAESSIIYNWNLFPLDSTPYSTPVEATYDVIYWVRLWRQVSTRNVSSWLSEGWSILHHSWVMKWDLPDNLLFLAKCRTKRVYNLVARVVREWILASRKLATLICTWIYPMVSAMTSYSSLTSRRIFFYF